MTGNARSAGRAKNRSGPLQAPDPYWQRGVKVMAANQWKKVHLYQCPCGYSYEPEKGCKEIGCDPGTPFEALRDQLTCPRCHRAKVHFREKSFSVPAD